MGQRVPQTMQRLAIVLVLAGVFYALLGLGILPESFNKLVAWIPFFRLVSLIVLLPLALLYSVYFLLLSLRGFDDMTITETGLVFPRRAVSDVLRNRPSMIPFAWIQRVALREIKGLAWVEVEYTLPDGRRRRRRVSQEWIPDVPAFCGEFEQRTGRRVE